MNVPYLLNFPSKIKILSKLALKISSRHYTRGLAERRGIFDHDSRRSRGKSATASLFWRLAGDLLIGLAEFQVERIDVQTFLNDLCCGWHI